jgi:hypothetical protein
VETIERGRYQSAIEGDDRAGSRVSWLAGARVTGNHERGQPGIGHHGDGRWEDDVIPIARAESERGDDNRGGPVEVVGREFTRAMYGIGDF